MNPTTSKTLYNRKKRLKSGRFFIFIHPPLTRARTRTRVRPREYPRTRARAYPYARQLQILLTNRFVDTFC